MSQNKGAASSQFTQSLQNELIGGVLDKSDLKMSFLSNGRFCPPEEVIPDLPSAFYKKFGYLRFLDLWIGIPDGPWAPEIWDADSQQYVSLGPTVSGTIYEPGITGTDWSPIVGTRGVYYSGEVLYSHLYKPLQSFDFPLAANSEFERTWPRNPFTGIREWPGRWKKDPITGIPTQNLFLGDQDIFIAFDDKIFAYQLHPINDLLDQNRTIFSAQQGYTIGAEVLAQVVGISEAYASNMVICDLKIINTSEWNYHDVYLGLYYEADNPYYDENMIYTDRYYTERTNYIKNQLNLQLNEIIPYNLSYSKSYYREDAGILGVQFVKTPLAENDEIDNDGDGVTDEPGEELGLTGWHFFQEYNILTLGNREKLQYQILSGDTTGLDYLIRNRRCFFKNTDGSLDPNFDNPSRIRTLTRGWWYSEGVVDHISNLMSCGPINWASGDTLDFVFAAIVADSIAELKSSAQIARKIVQNDYRRSESPPPPKVTAVAQDGKVTLYWDSSAENAQDFITNYYDFEGYKIYRTTSDPLTNDWGDPILDHEGKLINFVPVAKCDLKNGIKGYEKVHPFQKLGDDTELFHSWTDTSVTNGVTYWYSVCSYDHGITDNEELNPARYPPSPLKECLKGTDSEKDVNLVKVIPGIQATDYKAPTLKIEPLAENCGNGPIGAIIIDPYQITGHDYLITFEDTSYGFAVYDLYDGTENKLLFGKVQRTNGEEGIIFDGIQLTVQRYDNLEVLNEETYWYNYETGEKSNCTWSIFGGKLLWDPYPFEYDIIFTGKLDTSVFMKRTAPFEIWNTVLKEKALWDIYWNYAGTDTTDSLKNTWSSGDMIYIWDEFNEQNKFTLRIIISEKSVYTYQGLVNNPPQAGDAAHIALKRQFRTGDQFRISTTGMQKKEMSEVDYSEIKVVPNPYIVEAGWELSRNESRIQFINLPSECKIHIFTIAGDKVRTLEHNNPNTDYEFWDLLNNSNLKVSYGLYVYVVETPEGKITRGKFVILR